MPIGRRSEVDAATIIARLKRLGTKTTRNGMARFGIPSGRAFGVAVGVLKKEAKRIGRSHDLAAGLWDTGWYEARMLACFVDEPDRVTSQQMERWLRDFDSCAIVDTACFALFDRTPYAWQKVRRWAKRKREFEKRAAFALLWSLTVHDRTAADERFLQGLALIEQAAEDERHFVKKAVNMALRAVGKRNRVLYAAAVAAAKRLTNSTNPSSRWIGTDAIRELTSAAVTKRIAGKK